MSRSPQSDTRQQLKLFMDRMMAVNPQYIDIFGNGLPGMVGRSPATSGAANAGTDTVNQMRAKVVDFAKAYVNPQVALGEVSAVAQVIEGQLNVCVTLGVLAAAEADDLISTMQDLVQNR